MTAIWLLIVMSLIQLWQIGWLSIILIARIKRLIIQHLWDMLKVTMKTDHWKFGGDTASTGVEDAEVACRGCRVASKKTWQNNLIADEQLALAA